MMAVIKLLAMTPWTTGELRVIAVFVIVAAVYVVSLVIRSSDGVITYLGQARLLDDVLWALLMGFLASFVLCGLAIYAMTGNFPHDIQGIILWGIILNMIYYSLETTIVLFPRTGGREHPNIPWFIYFSIVVDIIGIITNLVLLSRQ